MDRILKAPGPLNLQGNVSDNWKLFEQSFENFLTAADYTEKEGKVKVAILLTCLGEECLPIYNSFSYDKEEDKYDLKKVMDKFKERCQPLKNITYDRHVFFTRKQREEETFDEFVTDLKNKASVCEFENLKDGLIRDQIICGIRANDVRKSLLKQSKLSLQTAIETCKAAELSETHVKSLNVGASASSQVNEVRAVKQKLIKNCWNCGKSHELNKCPAYGKTCSNCQKSNHFAQCCRSKKNDVEPGHKKNPHAKPKWKKRSKVHAVNQETLDDDSDDLFIGEITIATKNEDWSLKILVKDKPLKFKVDTGAQSDVLRFQDYQLVTNNKLLVKCRTKLVSYSGHRLTFLVNVNWSYNIRISIM